MEWMNLFNKHSLSTRSVSGTVLGAEDKGRNKIESLPLKSLHCRTGSKRNKYMFSISGGQTCYEDKQGRGTESPGGHYLKRADRDVF